jgi:hypothetical protein
MRRSRPSVFLVIPLLAAVGVAVLIVRHLTRPSPEAARETADEVITGVAGPASRPDPQALGRAKLAITVPPDSGLSSVSFAVVSTEHIVVERGRAPVDKQTGLVSPPAITVPSGKGYTLSVVGHSEAGSRRSVYLGSSTFDVPAGKETPVSFTPNAGVEHATGELAAAAVPSGATTPVSNVAACQGCELSSDQGACVTENITATSRTDPQTGDQTGVGWGCGTLTDPTAQSACLTLLHCLNANGCNGRPGENPVGECYCGAAAPEQCMGGQGITGACIAEYQAAARVSPGGPGPGAANGQLSVFIATASGDPTTPIGLADGIKLCATETQCDVCQAL